MSTLSQNERDGLEDVFLVIHSNQEKFQRIRELSALFIFKKNVFSIKKLLKVAKYGINESKIFNFLSFVSKKKKNLSK